MVATTTPNECLCARGLSPYIAENQILDVFRQYAAVKNVFIVRDPVSKISRGLAFIEFYSVEYAAFALQGVEASKVSMDSSGALLKVCFAKPSFLAAQIAQVLLVLLVLFYARSIRLYLFYVFEYCVIIICYYNLLFRFLGEQSTTTITTTSHQFFLCSQ